MAQGLMGLGLLLLAVAAALCWPVERDSPGERRPGLSLCLVDASASVTRLRPVWRERARAVLEAETLEAERAGRCVCLLVVGAQVERRFGPGPPAELSARLAGRASRPLDLDLAPGQQSASDWTAALELAGELLLEAEPSASRIVLIGDGTWTATDPAAALERLAARGLDFLAPEPAPCTRVDVGLAWLSLPESIEPGGALLVRGQVCLRGAQPGPPEVSLGFEIEDAAGSRALERVLALPQGVHEAGLPFAFDLGPVERGLVRVRARLRLPESGPDPFPENDELAANTRVAGALVIGLAAAQRAEAEAACGLLAAGGAVQGLELVALAAGELPVLARELDALLSLDLAPSSLDPAWLEPWLKGGGGWLALGLEGLLEPAGERVERDTSTWRLLPLTLAPSERPRLLTLLVDASGSMQGAPFEQLRVAALELAGSAPASDQLELRFFADHLEPPILLRPRLEGPQASALRLRAGELALAQLLAARLPSGGTALLAALELLSAEAPAATAAQDGIERLVLLLSDGRDATPESQRALRAGAVRARLAQRGLPLRILALGPDPDRELLQELLSDPAELVNVPDAAGLAQVLWREAHAGQLERGARLELAPVRAGPLAASLWPIEAPVALRATALVKLEARAGAEVLWLGPRAGPVVGAWRVGSGLALVCGCRPAAGEGDSGAWVQLASLARWLAHGRSRSAPRLEWRGQDLVLDQAVELAAAFVDLELRPLGASAGRSVRLFADPRRGEYRLRAPPELLAAEAVRGYLATLRDGAGGLLASRVLRSPLEPEERLPELHWQLPVEARGLREPGSAPATRAQSAHRLAPWSLLAGLLATCAGGWLRVRGSNLRAPHRAEGQVGAAPRR